MSQYRYLALFRMRFFIYTGRQINESHFLLSGQKDEPLIGMVLREQTSQSVDSSYVIVVTSKDPNCPFLGQVKVVCG